MFLKNIGNYKYLKMRTFIKIIISIILLVIGGAFGVSGVKILTLLFGFIVVLIWSYKPNKKGCRESKSKRRA